MGRGHRSSAARDVPEHIARPRYEVVFADEAWDELIELLTYIGETSPKNAGVVREAVADRLARLRDFPKAGHVDPNAPPAPPGAEARITAVKKVAVHYLFPMKWRGSDVVYVVSIRRGSRQPLREPDYVRRWLAEVARIDQPHGR